MDSMINVIASELCVADKTCITENNELKKCILQKYIFSVIYNLQNI